MDLVWKQVDVQESSGLLLAYIVDLDLMRIGSGMFTGNLLRLAGDQT